MAPEKRNPTNVFANLLRYRPRPDYTPAEDFFTEVVAAVLSYHPEIFWMWIGTEWPPYAVGDEIRVETQVRRAKLDEHDSSSIIDLVFRRTRQDRLVDVAYVESKLGSHEGDRQLDRYAHHLLAEETPQPLLIYATRHPDPKGERSDVKQIATRWFDLYHVLKEFEPQSPLISELQALMRYLRMHQDRTFTARDLFVASELPSTIGKFKEALDEVWKSEIEKRMTNQYWSASEDYQLRTHGRVVFWKETNDKLWGGDETAGLALCVGFLLTEERLPEAAVFVELSGEHSRRNRARDLFREFVADPSMSDWTIRHEDQPHSKLIRACPLSHFLEQKVGEDSVEKIVEFFRKSLKELKASS